jgi:sulfite reductase (ferredoxin)
LRVPRGIYEQRESGTYILRVRAPGGTVLPRHLRRLAAVSRTWGNGVLHVTTRQEFQGHRVPLDSIVPALRSLAEEGLSTEGGGGNTVRNITACQDAGVCLEELFDVTPYAIATTERLLADPVSLQLPRKFKVAFAGCDRDCSGAAVHDVGFVARKHEQTEGFAVYVGGGMGGKSRLASLLHEFIPTEEVFQVVESVKRVFFKHGDRKNKHLARLRFLVEKLGLEKFHALYEEERAAVRASNPEPLKIRPAPETPNPKTSPIPNGTADTTFTRWRASHVVAQKQPGLFLVHLPLPLGDLPAEKAIALAQIVENHGERSLRGTQSQNLLLRGVPETELPELLATREAIKALPAAQEKFTSRERREAPSNRGVLTFEHPPGVFPSNGRSSEFANTRADAISQSRQQEKPGGNDRDEATLPILFIR